MNQNVESCLSDLELLESRDHFVKVHARKRKNDNMTPVRTKKTVKKRLLPSMVKTSNFIQDEAQGNLLPSNYL